MADKARLLILAQIVEANSAPTLVSVLANVGVLLDIHSTMLNLDLLVGFRLAKLTPNTKKPDGGVGWQDRVVPASEAKWSDVFNVGVMGGTPVSGGGRLLVIDVDVKNDQPGLDSWERLRVDFGLPETTEVVTPSGGMHFYYSAPADAALDHIAKACDRMGYPGIDLIGDRSFVVAPPSSIDGRDYVWRVPPSNGIADIPPAFLHAVESARTQTPESRSKSSGKRPFVSSTSSELSAEKLDSLTQDVIKRFQIAGPGERNARVSQAVAYLTCLGLAAGDIEVVMVRWHQHYAGLFSTDMDEALRLLRSCVGSAERKFLDGGLVSVADLHMQDVLSLQLSELQVEYLDELRVRTRRGRRRLTPLEKRALTCVILHAQRQLRGHVGADEFIMTTDQLVGQYVRRFDVADTDDTERSIRRALGRFVSRKDKPAPCELLFQVRVGGIVGGKKNPSKYRLTGLTGALADG